MSSPVFYRTVLERKLNDSTRVLFESLLVRNEKIDELYRIYPDQIRALQYRGKGEPPPLTTAEIEEKEERKRQAQIMEQRVKTLATLISSEEFFLQSALETEQTALGHEKEMHENGDPDELELGRPILELREANIREIKAFFAGR